MSKETTTTTLGDLLTEDQIGKVEAILNGVGDSFLKVNALKELFASIKGQLEEKGVDDEYLAYAVMASFAKG